MEFIGSALDDLRSFSVAAKHRAGYQLELVQSGDDPADWRSMPSVGAGCREIRIRDDANIYRVLYVATMNDAVYVLHCFVKKTQETSKADLDLGKQRYKQMRQQIASNRLT